jgi:hypothetical protein
MKHIINLACLIIALVFGLYCLGMSQECSKVINIGTTYDKDSLLIFKKLTEQLDSIYLNDQKYRSMLKTIEERYGCESIEVQNHWKTIYFNDSLNLEKVTQILDKYGWLGSDKVGKVGNQALFLVIQHSNKIIMEKYMPMMKEAAKKDNAPPQSVAMLQDRIEMLNGRPQIYGTQIQFINGKNVLYKVIDEKNLNKRRADVGLGPIEDYLKHWNIDYKLPVE